MEQSKSPNHQPVLLKEVIASLQLRDGQTIVDGTLGLGGYSEEALRSAKGLKVVAFDLDQENLRLAKEKLAEYSDQMIYVNDNFANIKRELENLKIEKIDGLMLDLGLSSPQIDLAERGFSFGKEGPLDMRYGKDQPLTAADVINSYGLEQLTKIFREYGEERHAYKIARAILQRRSEKDFTTTTELADFIAETVGGKKERIHPATRVFQALRIEVNRELSSLEQVLNDSVELMNPQARLAVVSYHSLEDRIVKNFFRDSAREFVNLPNELTTRYLQPKLRLINKKPLRPSNEEVMENPRSRSAKLRIAERI